jgi:hypothetical protein
MRKRLRSMPDRAALDQLYAQPHRHTQWDDHRIRVDVTVAIGAHLLCPAGVVADLSCGDAAIPKRIAAARNARTVLGDYAPGYEHTGPIEETITVVQPGSVDLWVCSETIEHLDDPDKVLEQIRARTDRLILSTPDGETDDANPEHVWGWDSDAVGTMLRDAGFDPLIHTILDLRPAGFVYSFQIWACK